MQNLLTLGTTTKLTEAGSVCSQIGALKEYFLFADKRLHKRSLSSSESHHKTLRDEPRVSDSIFGVSEMVKASTHQTWTTNTGTGAKYIEAA